MTLEDNLPRTTLGASGGENRPSVPSQEPARRRPYEPPTLTAVSNLFEVTGRGGTGMDVNPKDTRPV